MDLTVLQRQEAEPLNSRRLVVVIQNGTLGRELNGIEPLSKESEAFPYAAILLSF